MKPLALLAVLALSGCFGGWSRFAPERARGFALRRAARPYFAYVPSGEAPPEGWPTVLFLHGGGESGDVPARPTQVGLGPHVAQSDGRFPFVVLFPQCPRRTDWTSARGEAAALDALDDAMRALPIDPARVYLVGNSMGGHGALLIGARHPDRFAALVSVAGRAGRSRWFPTPRDARELETKDPASALAERLATLPSWLLHGEEDAITPPVESRRLAEAMRAAGAEVRLTIFPGAGHAAAWERAYEAPDLYAWLLTHRR